MHSKYHNGLIQTGHRRYTTWTKRKSMLFCQRKFWKALLEDIEISGDDLARCSVGCRMLDGWLRRLCQSSCYEVWLIFRVEKIEVVDLLWLGNKDHYVLS